MNYQKVKEKPLITLVKEELTGISGINLSSHYTTRYFRYGDESVWECMVFDTYRRKIDFKDHKHDYAFRPKRILFICYDNHPIATVSAWYRAEWGLDTGYLYMPAVCYSHSHNVSLIRCLAQLALDKFKAERRKKAIVQTDDFRLEEIKSYLYLGFKPLIIHDNQRERWKKIFCAIQRPELEKKFCTRLTANVYSPNYGRQDKDTRERTESKHKWYPHREHRCVGGSIDAMADESLYRPSVIGTAGTYISSIIAGSTNILKLWFRAGIKGLNEGESVMFCMKGQEPLGCTFQTDDPLRSAYVKLIHPENCVLKAVSDPSYMKIGFKVEKGFIKQGDTVKLTVGEPDGFEFTPLAGRYEIKVVARYESAEFEKRLPEPIVINILPGEVERLEATLPCTSNGSGSVHMHVTARDGFDNRAPFTGRVIVQYNDKKKDIQMIEGKADCFLDIDDDKPAQAVVSCSEKGQEFKSNICVHSDDLQFYVGDLHCHDFFSEAQGYTDELYKWAKEEKNLDFLSLSVQAHGWIDNDKWSVIKYMNERYLNEGRFVTLLANEWQHTGYGDKIIHFLGGDHPYLCVDDSRYSTAPKLYEALRECDAVVIGHHTAYPPGEWCPANDFDSVEDDVERLVELWSMHGSSEGFDPNDRLLSNFDERYTAMAALRRGLRLGFTGGSDTHSGRPGGSAKEPLGCWGGLCGVWAKSLTRRSIFEAIRSRHTVALTGSRIVLRMLVNGAIMGSEVPLTDTAQLQIDVWAPRKIRKIQIIKNTALLKEYESDSNEFHGSLTNKTNGSAFYHCRVEQADGHLAVCSPVWVG